MKFQSKVGRTNKATSSRFQSESVAVQETEKDTNWAVGIGYDSKVILADLLRIWLAAKNSGNYWAPEEKRDGLWYDDLVIDAFKFTADIGYGRTRKLDRPRDNEEKKDAPQVLEDQLENETTWEVSLTYSLPVEHLWGHLRYLGQGRKRDGDKWKLR